MLTRNTDVQHSKFRPEISEASMKNKNERAVLDLVYRALMERKARRKVSRMAHILQQYKESYAQTLSPVIYFNLEQYTSITGRIQDRMEPLQGEHMRWPPCRRSTTEDDNGNISTFVYTNMV